MDSLVTFGRAQQYRTMWVFVSFDLPVQTEKQRRDYTRFRNGLIKDGFVMQQYSLYIRHCGSRENAEVHQERVRKSLPPVGKVMMYLITDRQWGLVETFFGPKAEWKRDSPGQLIMF